ncbi:MAG: insulinase family protein [Proteobacteria bacterium]|nr:insulinase family protein [Pseudomonadota bacterium]
MDALPKDLPPYGPDRPPPPLHIEQRTLSNGLQVWVLPRTDGPPMVQFALAVRGGLADDPPLQPGLSSLLADLLKEGTASRSAAQIAADLQSWGGQVHTEANVDGITITASGLASNAAKIVTLLSEIALSPSFPRDEVEQGKLRALQALVAARTDPDWLARKALGPLLYPGHPYGRVLPTEKSLLSITQDTLASEHDRRFRPDEALLVVSGRIGADDALRMADAVFGDWRAEGKPSVGVGPAPATAPAERVFVARGDSVQSAIRLGGPAAAYSSPDYYPLLVANAVLGQGFRSRLNLDLREDKGYTYGAGSVFHADRMGGSVIAYADVRNEVTGAAIGRFLADYGELGNQPVPDAELAQTRHYLVGSYLLFNQPQGQVADALAAGWLAGRPPQSLADFVPRVEAVTAAQVQDAARKYFAPGDPSIVVVGNPAVLPQLRPYGTFDTSR